MVCPHLHAVCQRWTKSKSGSAAENPAAFVAQSVCELIVVLYGKQVLKLSKQELVEMCIFCCFLLLFIFLSELFTASSAGFVAAANYSLSDASLKSKTLI